MCGYCGSPVTEVDTVEPDAGNFIDTGGVAQPAEPGKQEDDVASSVPPQETVLNPDEIEPDVAISSGPALELTAESIVEKNESSEPIDAARTEPSPVSKSEPLELTDQNLTVLEGSLQPEDIEVSPPGQNAQPVETNSQTPLELVPETEIDSSGASKSPPPDASGTLTPGQGKNDAGESPRTVPAEVDALKQQKMAQAKALLEKKAALAQAEALKKQKAALARAEALKSQKAAALQKKKAALAQAEAAQHSNPAAVKTAVAPKEGMAMTMEPRTRMMELLKKYEGKAIGINYDNSAEIREAELVEANQEYFRISVAAQKLFYNFPLQTVLTVVEGEDGVDAGEGGQGEKFNAVIKLYPLVLFYKLSKKYIFKKSGR